MKHLNEINSRADLLQVSPQEEGALCEEIRQYLIQCVSQNGGHLASNLGVVELSVAIEKEFDTSRDRLVFDVGHQSYVHKILTGRRDQLPTLRKFGGLSGFPKPSESETDAFTAGHASSAVSIALGMARARTLRGEHYHVLALLGDGAMTGGLAYEGMNDAGASSEPLIVILNDNGMSITPNVGGIAKYLRLIRTKPGYFKLKKCYRKLTRTVPGGRTLYRCTHYLKESFKRHTLGINLFEEMGFQYMGPVDGHDITRLIYMLRRAKEMQCPVLLHVLTQKGRGYAPAEENPDLFHGVGQFDSRTGQTASGGVSFSDTFGQCLTELAGQDSRICAVTAAMRSGTGLDGFAAQFPERFYDVGIAEGHAVSMAGGLAKQGMIPVVAVYSTFLQRAYDMILQDTALLNLHVVFAVDRAGLVGADGSTHHGEFDPGYLRHVPGMTIYCPASQAELRRMLREAVLDCTGPVAVRYPRGGDGRYTGDAGQVCLRAGSDVTLLCYGAMVNPILEAAALLEQRGISAAVLKLPKIKPLELEEVFASVRQTGRLFIAEDTADAGCVAHPIISALAEAGIPALVRHRNTGDGFVVHGSVTELYRLCGLDAESLAQWVTEETAKNG